VAAAPQGTGGGRVRGGEVPQAHQRRRVGEHNSNLACRGPIAAASGCFRRICGASRLGVLICRMSDLPIRWGPLWAARRWHEPGVDSREEEVLPYGIHDLPREMQLLSNSPVPARKTRTRSLCRAL
jgi:hypothetical protein